MEMIHAQVAAQDGETLREDVLLDTLRQGLAGRFARQRLLVLIPDHTRTLPLPFLFRTLTTLLSDASRLDFMVALGTHPPLDAEALNRLVGITAGERATIYKHIGLLNHAWDDDTALASLGAFEDDEIRSLAGRDWHASLPQRVEIRINRLALECDAILIVGPTFPHEVAGFSGGEKYLFPGISGPELIHATHWLGALAGVVATIGRLETPVRAMIHAATGRLRTPVTLVAMVMDGHAPAGLFIGDTLAAWQASAEVSSRRNVVRHERPFQRVLSCAPAMYDELWTAAKAMYKVEPVASVGGEVILHAPHLQEVSRVHGKHIREIGYHILPYFLADWERFKHIPRGVLAHSTHLRGAGVMEAGLELPNVRLTLASRISAAECEHLGLGYQDPASIKVEEWMGREAQGILCVPDAGEKLHLLREAEEHGL